MFPKHFNKNILTTKITKTFDKSKSLPSKTPSQDSKTPTLNIHLLFLKQKFTNLKKFGEHRNNLKKTRKSLNKT